MSEQTPSQRYHEKLRKQGMSTYVLWVPNDSTFKARLKAIKDKMERDFLRSNNYDHENKEWK